MFSFLPVSEEGLRAERWLHVRVFQSLWVRFCCLLPGSSSKQFFKTRDIFFPLSLCPLWLLKFCTNTNKDLSSVFKGGRKSRINDTIVDSTISIFSAKCNTGFPSSRDCGASCRNWAKDSPSRLPGPGLPGPASSPRRAGLSHLLITEPHVPFQVRKRDISASTCQLQW